MKSFKNLIFLFLIIGIISGCHVYSFTGASISPDIKTVSIQFFPNKAPIVQPSLSQVFTEKLKDKFVSETSLSLIKENGDLNFEGAIMDYNTQPTAITGNDNASLNRLTINVSVKFTNTKDPKQDFETNFSRYADYDSRKSLSAVEQDLITQINSQLVDDIFNKAVVNW
ncbi:MAG TPA: LptE family protein [Bacteroidia bacterium]|nr:LptE family protein [Bacteroidia bacterium]